MYHFSSESEIYIYRNPEYLVYQDIDPWGWREPIRVVLTPDVEYEEIPPDQRAPGVTSGYYAGLENLCDRFEVSLEEKVDCCLNHSFPGNHFPLLRILLRRVLLNELRRRQELIPPGHYEIEWAGDFLIGIGKDLWGYRVEFHSDEVGIRLTADERPVGARWFIFQDITSKSLYGFRGNRKRLDFCTVTSHVEVTGSAAVMECWLKHTKVLKRLASVLATALTLGQGIKLDDGFYAYDETKFGTAAQISVTGPTVGFLEVPKTESELALWDPTDGTGYHRLTQG